MIIQARLFGLHGYCVSSLPHDDTSARQERTIDLSKRTVRDHGNNLRVCCRQSIALTIRSDLRKSKLCRLVNTTDNIIGSHTCGIGLTGALKRVHELCGDTLDPDIVVPDDITGMVYRSTNEVWAET